MNTRNLPRRRKTSPSAILFGTLVGWILLGMIGGLLLMLSFAILHGIFPAIPAIGYLQGVGLCFVVWVVKKILR